MRGGDQTPVINIPMNKHRKLMGMSTGKLFYIFIYILWFENFSIPTDKSEAPSPLHRLALTNSQLRPDKVVPIQTQLFSPVSDGSVKRSNSRKSLAAKRGDGASEKTADASDEADDGFKFGSVPPPPSCPPPMDSP